MRFVMRFIGVLAAALLFAMPVMGISAQGGAVVPSPVIPETGTGGEIQALTEGLLYHGSGYVPGIVASTMPGQLPATGLAGDPMTDLAEKQGLLSSPESAPIVIPDAWIDGQRDTSGIVTSRAPRTLPATGAQPNPYLELLEQYRQMYGGSSPAPASQTGTGMESLLPEEIVGTMAGQSAAPARLPVTGSQPNPYLELLEQYRQMYGGSSPAQLPQAGTGAESLLPEEIVGVMASYSAVPAQLPMSGASSKQTSFPLPRIETHPDSSLGDAIDLMTSAAPGAPEQLPVTGASPVEPPYYEALPGFLAPAPSLDGLKRLDPMQDCRWC